MISITLEDRYFYMVWMREFENTCLQGVSTREIHGELHTGIGQEAVAAGMAGFLRQDDALVSTHRNHLHAIAKGVNMRAMLAEIFERSTGLCGGFGGHMHLFDVESRFSATGIVGAGLPVALGHAYGFRLRGVDSVAVAVVGDGAVNTGAFHEAMNMIGALRLPVVVLVENNQWAISVPFEQSSATETIAERAVAWAAQGARVDGNDPLAVAEAFGDAVERARRDAGPSIIEALCYRFRGHFEGDADTYRIDKSDHLTRDPLDLVRSRLIAAGASGPLLDARSDAIRNQLRALLDSVRQDPAPEPATALHHLFVTTEGAS